ncbi:MAG TPA: septal ring lytic transglycosylase RlpA family protein [Terriglobales bacterium]|nr:septal ring lytic transglycosylase RlpA family protein [Terriglobales bacterium]
MSISRTAVLFLLAGALLLSGCSHRSARVSVPPPPSIPENPPPAATSSTPSIPSQPAPAPAIEQPLFVETGTASWYGPPYHNRKSSDGEIYNMNALTAAHRTLPLGSIVRVTNVSTQHSVVVRITDRGPFIPGRIVDLSLAAAKAVDVWRPGLARVKVELLQTPAPLNAGGRWAVQIGAFEDQESATELRDHLARRYHTARVHEFASPTGNWWLQVRVLQDDKQRAEEVARDTHTAEGAVFLVRLD